MSRLRLLLFWLLTFAVPLQGLAAGSMLFCAGKASAAQAQPAHPHAGGQAHASHHDEGPAASDAAAAAAALLVPAHDCSLCAACCHALAATQAARTPGLVPPGIAPASPPPLVIASRAIRLPEKPPRA